MVTTSTIGGPMQGTSINDSRRKYNLKNKKKKKKLKTILLLWLEDLEKDCILLQKKYLSQ